MRTKPKAHSNNVFLKYKHLIIDAIISFVLIVCIGLDFLFKTSFYCLPISVDIILILLPSIIATISISLSLYKEKIFFTERNKFNKLRNGYSYSFLCMVLITIFIFVVYTVCYFFNLSIAKMCLDVVVVYYTVYFSVQEIPLITQNDKAIQKILRNAYFDILKKGSFDDSFEDKRNIINETIHKMIFSPDIGLKHTYLIFRSKEIFDSNLLDDLLSRENDFLFDAVDNIPIIASSPNGDLNGIRISDIIDQGYENLFDLLNFSDEYNYSKIFAGEDKIHQLTRSLFSLCRLTNSLSLKKKQSNNMNKILFLLTINIDKKEALKNVAHSFLNTMMTATLNNGETWFAEHLRDYDYSFYIFSSDSASIGHFYLIYCYFLSKLCSSISTDNKTKIETFVNSPSGGLNGDGISWIKKMLSFIESANDDVILNSIKEFITIYDASNNGVYYFVNKSGMRVYSDVENVKFCKYHLFDIWLEVLVFSPYNYFSEAGVLAILNSFGGNDKNILLTRMSEKWLDIDKNCIKDNAPVGFLNYLGIKSKKVKDFNDNHVVKTLLKYRNENYKTKETSRIEKITICDSDASKHKNELMIAFNNAVSNYPLLNKDIDLSEEKEVCFAVRFISDQIDSSINEYIKQMPLYLSNIVRAEVIKRVEPNIESKTYTLTKEMIDEVIGFKPEFMTENSTIQYYPSDEVKQYINKEVKKVENSYLPPNIFWKKGGISANFEYISERSDFRRPTKTEIDKIIDDEYKMINGLYKYMKYSNSDAESFLLTREELSNYLLKTLFFSQIVFKYKVSIDKNKIFLIKKIDD